MPNTPKHLLLSFVAVAALSLTAFSEAKATSCSSEHQSLEEAFIRSDVVFLGILGEEHDSGIGYGFEISELYKAPADFDAENPPPTTLADASYLRSHSEIFVFSNFAEHDGVTYLLAPQCGKTAPTPQASVQRLKQIVEEKGGARTDEYAVLSFIGKVLTVNHTANPDRPKNYKKWAPYADSEIEFDVMEWIHLGHPDPDFEEKNHVVVAAQSCGYAYTAGQEYLVRANAETVFDEERRPSIKYKISCTSRQPFNLLTKEILRDLSSAYKNKENNNGNQYNK